MKLCDIRVQHIANPLHIYCRLIDFGVSARVSKRLGIIYERCFYQYFSKGLKRNGIPQEENPDSRPG